MAEKSGDNNDHKMRKVKSIDQLYREVRDYDLVITNDAALATALNKMIDKPTIGSFALTPQEIATMSAIETLGTPMLSELKVAMNVHEETGIDFRTVHSTIQYIQEVRRYTAEVRSHLYTQEARDIYESYKANPTLEKVMENFNSETCSLYLQKGKVAVIGLYIDYSCDKRYGDLDLFNDLEKRMLPPPDRYTEILPYSGTEEEEDNFLPYEMEEIYQVGNDRQIADNAIALIPKEKAEDYAIVLKSDSPLADAVRASLYRKNIPFVNELTVKDLNQIRDYIEFISLSLSFETIRGEDIRELFSTLNLNLPESIDQHLVSKEDFNDLDTFSSKEMEDLRLFMKDIRNWTFEEVRKKVFPKDSSSVKILIDDLKLTDEKVTSTRLSRAIYAVDNVSDLHHNEQIPPDEKEGVLLADCGNSVYIDRPVVIYLGMEQDWNLDLTNKKYVPEKTEEAKKAAARLEILLQQGEKRFYIVNTSKDGEESRPCLSFDDILSKPVKKFDDICSNIIRASWVDDSNNCGDEPDTVSPEAKPYDENLSQSALAQYYKCPRAYMFHSLVPSEENKYMEFGNIVHEFAEFYVTHKELVEKYGLDFFIDKACDRYSGITSPMTEELDRNKIGCAMRNVKTFLDSLSFSDVKLDKPLDEGKNYFFGCVEPAIDISSTMCETDRKCDDLHIHGKMDLFVDGVIIDYKTGKAKTGKDIVDAMNYEKPPKMPDFQPLVYLALGKELDSTKNEFRLFYAMNNDSQSGTEGYDIRDNIRSVYVTDKKDKDFLCDPRVMDAIDKNLNSRVSFRKDIPRFVNCISSAVSGPSSTWIDQQDTIVNAVKAEYDAKESTIRNSVDVVLGIMQKGIAGSETEVVVSTEALDRFLEEVDRVYSEISRLSVSKEGFPAKPVIDCKDCDYYSICTKEVIDVSEGGNVGE